uniref:Reverse transcriptase domain-containing protein n=1 Tax=Arion vulgaris TaxID=1028688 RepID=A0A0B7BCU9_9EUPU
MNRHIKLKPFLHKLIHADQQCSVPHRNISKHTYLIRDIIQYTHQKNTQSAILSIDQEKAFDRVSHDFLHKITHDSNTGHYFSKWIKIIYKNPESRLLINHTLTDSFLLTRSVRQGCSLSPLLFVLVLEPVLEKIRQDPTIQGTFIPGLEDKKLTAYADDTVFFPSNYTSIRNIFKTHILQCRK